MSQCICLYFDFKKAVGALSEKGKLSFFSIESNLSLRQEGSVDSGGSEKKLLFSYFKKLLKHLDSANCIYLMGTYQAKAEFEAYISRNQEILKKIVISEATPELRDHQIQRRITRLLAA